MFRLIPLIAVCCANGALSKLLVPAADPGKVDLQQPTTATYQTFGPPAAGVPRRDLYRGSGLYRNSNLGQINPASPPRQFIQPQSRYRDSGRYQQEQFYPPTPYAFDYAVDAPDGGHSRTEKGDGAGRVTGSYTIRLADGRTRVVEYIADERGYRATVKTNEFGTENQSPADVVFESSAIPGKEAALLGDRDLAFKKYGPAYHRP